MTRFARASGSKGSNEKRPEEATSWEEMRSAILNKTNDSNTTSAIVEDDENLALEIESVWADILSNTTSKKKPVISGVKSKSKKNKEAKVVVDAKDKRKKTSEPEAVVDAIDKSAMKKQKKEKKKALKVVVDSENKQTVKRKKSSAHETVADVIDERAVKKQKKLKKIKDSKVVVDSENKQTVKRKSLAQEIVADVIDERAAKKQKKKKKLDAPVELPMTVDDSDTPKPKRKKRKAAIDLDDISQPQETKKRKVQNDDTVVTSNSKKLKKKRKVTNVDKQGKTGELSGEVIANGNGHVSYEGAAKMKKRRKAPLEHTEMIINGKTVKVQPFDGFLVQADDAERLRALRKNMKMKGLPEKDREAAIKLERRRAEKALARLRKQVCFHCRASGHNLSECPSINQDQTPSGICYKCGSTEHTHFQCKVTRGQDFRYAECFICKEQGHIARQCPDNPRGLYPKGGACSVCGDVTHLKKDCPQHLAEKEEKTMTVGTQNYRGLEAIEDDGETVAPKATPNARKSKHIRF